MGRQWRAMKAPLVAVGVLLCAGVVAGLDCEAAHKAMASTCEIFGRESQPCHMLRFHHTAKCAGDVELGESQAPAGNAIGQVMAKEAQAASHGAVLQTIKLANEVYDKAKEMCKCHPKVAGAKKGAKKPAAGAEARQEIQKMAAKGEMTGAGAKAAKGLSLDAAKQFAKKVKKTESKSLDDPLSTAKEKKEEKEEQKLEAKNAIKAEKAQANLRIQQAGAQAAADGKDPNKVMKKLKQKEKEKQAATAAALPGSVDDNSAARKEEGKVVDKEQKKVDAKQRTGMMNALPANMGFKTAFSKVLQMNKDANIAAKDKQNKEKAEEAATNSNIENGGTMTPEAQGQLVKQEEEKASDKLRNGPNPFRLGDGQGQLAHEESIIEGTSLSRKKTVNGQDSFGLRQEENKVEQTALPSSDGDSVMYGETGTQLADEIISPKGISKAKLAHAAADAKAAAKVAELDDTVGRAYDGDGGDIDVAELKD